MPYLAPACSKQLARHEHANGKENATNKTRVMAAMVGSKTRFEAPKCDFHGRISTNRICVNKSMNSSVRLHLHEILSFIDIK